MPSLKHLSDLPDDLRAPVREPVVQQASQRSDPDEREYFEQTPCNYVLHQDGSLYHITEADCCRA